MTRKTPGDENFIVLSSLGVILPREGEGRAERASDGESRRSLEKRLVLMETRAADS